MLLEVLGLETLEEIFPNLWSDYQQKIGLSANPKKIVIFPYSMLLSDQRLVGYCQHHEQLTIAISVDEFTDLVLAADGLLDDWEDPDQDFEDFGGLTSFPPLFGTEMVPVGVN